MGWRGPMTAVQQRVWQDWIEEDMDRPSRDNWYVMALTEILYCHALKDWKSYDESRRKLRFTTDDSRVMRRLGGVDPEKPDPRAGTIDPFESETDEERQARYERQYGSFKSLIDRQNEQERDVQ